MSDLPALEKERIRVGVTFTRGQLAKMRARVAEEGLTLAHWLRWLAARELRKQLRVR